MWYNAIPFPLTEREGRFDPKTPDRPTFGPTDKETRISEPHAS